MKSLALALALAGTLPVLAQFKLPELVSIRSRSGQFVVVAPPAASPHPALAPFLTNRAFVRVDAPVLVVSAERVKYALLITLGAPDAWQGKIFLHLRPAQSPADEIVVLADRFPEGWTYRLDLPDLLKSGRLLRALTDVLLLELANRNACQQSVTLPPWLSAGLPRYLESQHEPALLVATADRPSLAGRVRADVREARRAHPLQRAHEVLRAVAPIPFAELATPGPDAVAGSNAEVYALASQLFLTELLRLPGGAARLHQFLIRLPLYPDWQSAFLEAFAPHFRESTDVERWWSLQWLHFTGRELRQTWSRAESWQKLEEWLRPPVAVRLQSEEAPLQTDVSLQTILRAWGFRQQAETLRARLAQLHNLRLRLAPEVQPVAEDYRRTLAEYVQQLEKKNVLGAPNPTRQARGERLARHTIRQLDAIDAKRESLRRMLSELPESRSP